MHEDKSIFDDKIILEKEKLAILIEKNKQVENTIYFIIKLYPYVFGFLFIYSGFVSKEFLQTSLDNPFSIENTNFIRMSILALGLILIGTITVFWKFRTMGIAHEIKQRLKYKYEINKIMHKDNLLDGLEIEQFLKISVIYTLTTSIIVLGSIFYLLLMWGYENHIVITLTMTASIISILIFPKVNTYFYIKLIHYLKEFYEENNKEYTCPKCLDSEEKKSTPLTIFTILLIVIFIYIEILVYTSDFSTYDRNFIYLGILASLISIEYVYIHRKINIYIRHLQDC